MFSKENTDHFEDNSIFLDKIKLSGLAFKGFLKNPNLVQFWHFQQYFLNHKNLNPDPWQEWNEELLKQKLFQIKNWRPKMVAQRPVLQISMLLCSIVFIMNHSSILEYHNLLVHYSTIFKESGKYIQFTAVLLPIRVFPLGILES